MVLDSSVDDSELVCPHCYRKVRERIDAQKIIRDPGDYRIFGEEDRCYLNVFARNPDKDAEIIHPLDDRVEATEHGVYCWFCGADINNRSRGYHRTTTAAVVHARKLAEVYRANGYEVDESVLVERVRSMKKDETKTNEGHEIFREALRGALR